MSCAAPACNFLGPLFLGHLFDTLGRRIMISGTYTISALLLLVTGGLFLQDALSASGQTAMWTVIFFFASAAASSAYLTASEVFPLELRALAIAVFWGYALCAALMLIAAAVEWRLGVDAERSALEDVATPLSVRAEMLRNSGTPPAH